MQFVYQCGLFSIQIIYHSHTVYDFESYLLCFDDQPYLNCSLRCQRRVRSIEKTNQECTQKNDKLEYSVKILNQEKLSFGVWWQKLAELEKYFETITQEKLNANTWLKRHVELGDCLNKMSQMKGLMKSTIDEIERKRDN